MKKNFEKVCEFCDRHPLAGVGLAYVLFVLPVMVAGVIFNYI